MNWAETSNGDPSPAPDVQLLAALEGPDGVPTLSTASSASEACASQSGLSELLDWQAPAVCLVEPDGLAAMGVLALAHGFLWIELPVPGPQYRGRLGLFIEETVEDRLEQMGALSPGIHASTGLDASLSDQLYRARLLEMRGIALGVPNLDGIANLGRTLDAEDGAVLRWWLAAASERPIRVAVSMLNATLRVYPSPVAFEQLFDVAPEPLSPRAPCTAMASSRAAMELSDLPPAVQEAPTVETEDDEVGGAQVDNIAAFLTPEVPVEEAPDDGPITQLYGTAAMKVQSEGSAWSSLLDQMIELPGLDEALGLPEPAAAPAQVRAPQPAFSAAPALVSALDDAEPAADRAAPPAATDALESVDADEFLRVLEHDSRQPPPTSPTPAVVEPSKVAGPQAPVGELPTKKVKRPFVRLAEPHGRSEPTRVVAQVSALAAPEKSQDPFSQLAQKEWKNWRQNLIGARGPKPLSAVERMFVTDYTRLREAIRRGIADESAVVIADEWQASFAKSYAETFDALRLRGKRPTMVLDLPELAQRLARLQGARRVQLLLVDAMRFDLGLMVQERLRARVDAALTERLLLWSALPTTTTYQLELLGKGADGLRERGTTEEPPALVARGRSAHSARRIRVGHVELQKIDVIEDGLRQAGRPVLERFEELANDTAAAVAEHLSQQLPRTLVVVFGDHGFALDPTQAGTTAEVRQGGASPEEVLVPAFAWLTGAVH